MASKAPNLKINIGADTKDFAKGAREAKQGIKDLESVSSGAVGKIGEAFGVNAAQLQKMSSALKGLGATLGECGSAGAKAFGGILSAINPVGIAIAGLGIGAAVKGFKDLQAEAENFKTTIAGANMEMATSAYIDTFKQALHDLNKENGKSVAESQSAWKEFWAKMNAGRKFYFSSGQFGLDMAAGEGGVGATNDNSRYTGALDEAAKKAQRAKEISNEIYEIQRKQSDLLPVIAGYNSDIAEYLQKAGDKENSLADRAAYYAEAIRLTTEKFDKQVELANQLTALMKENVSLTESTPEQVDAVNQQEAASIALLGQKATELRGIQRRQQAVNAELTKEVALRAQAAAQANAIALSRQELKNTPMGISADAQKKVKPSDISASLPDQIEMPIVPKIDGDAFKAVGINLSSAVQELAISLSSSIGSLIGDLINGEDAWGNFGKAAVSAFADMAIAIGKMAIAFGVTAIGIQELVTNPYLALAAGAALVALGTAAKTSISNATSGGSYSASAAVATSGVSSYTSSDYASREVTVNVTGTMKADGNQLVAVIQNTEKHNNYTT